MKKKKAQATEQYIAGLDSTIKKKLDFVKAQGTFLQRVLSPLERQGELCKFAIKCFERSAIQFPIEKSSEEPASEAREWGSLSELKEMKQFMSQEQMKAICHPISEDPFSLKSDTLPEQVMIDFEEEYLAWHEQMILLDDAVIEIEFSTNPFPLVNPLMSPMQSINYYLGDKIKATVFIQEKDGKVQAFLKATGDDGEDYFFELSHFSMLFLLDRDQKNLYEGIDCRDAGTLPAESTDAVTPKEETEPKEYTDNEDGDVGMFVLFNKPNRMMFVTTY